MALKAWIAKNTGLPTLWTDYTAPVYRNGQVWWTPTLEQLSIPLSLPLSPIGEAVTYKQGGSSYTLTRATPSGGGHMLTTLDGHASTSFRWIGEDSTDLGVEVFTANTSAGLISRWPLMPPERTFTLDCLTDTDQTAAMEKIIAAKTPLLLFHNTAACDMNPCDIEPIRAVVVTKASHARTRRTPAAQRRWSLSCSTRDIATIMGGAGEFTSALTWGHWDAYDHQWKRRTYLELCRLITGMP